MIDPTPPGAEGELAPDAGSSAAPAAAPTPPPLDPPANEPGPGEPSPGVDVASVSGEPPVAPEPGEPSIAAEPAADAARPARSGGHPTFVFFGVVSAVSLLLDIISKTWAETVLSRRIAGDPSLVVVENHLTFTLAYNKGGAWGLLQDASEAIRRPFFLLVSVAAIVFIVSLYSRLAKAQHALKWGLPLVLGGALGNLTDRIVRNSVIDFIDYRADWVATMNELIRWLSPTWSITDHWPTFNVADISICIGVGLMAVDMLFARRGRTEGPVSAHAAGPEHPTTTGSEVGPGSPASAAEPGEPAR